MGNWLASGYKPPEDPEVRRMRRLATKKGLRLEKQRGPRWRETTAGTVEWLPAYRLLRHESYRPRYTDRAGVRHRRTHYRWRVVAEGSLAEMQQYLDAL